MELAGGSASLGWALGVVQLSLLTAELELKGSHSHEGLHPCRRCKQNKPFLP